MFEVESEATSKANTGKLGKRSEVLSSSGDFDFTSEQPMRPGASVQNVLFWPEGH